MTLARVRLALFILAIVLLFGAMFIVGIRGMMADTSGANNRIESRPTFLYNCTYCHD